MPKASYKPFHRLSTRQQNRLVQKFIANINANNLPNNLDYDRHEHVNIDLNEDHVHNIHQETSTKKVNDELMNSNNDLINNDEDEYFDIWYMDEIDLWYDAEDIDCNEYLLSEDSSHEKVSNVQLDEGDWEWVDEENEDEIVRKLINALRKWCAEEKVNLKCLNSLLAILRENIKDLKKLPKDARTIMQTLRSTDNIKEVSSGYYYHFTVREGILIELGKMPVNDVPDTLELQFGIDGLPIKKSTKDQFWPITARICNIESSSLFTVGIYYGTNKPSCTAFLIDSVKELNQLMETGILFESKLIKIKVANIICDAPARAFVAQIKNHNSYHGCGKCTDEGSRRDDKYRQCFVAENKPLRTDASFRNRLCEDHHIGNSELENLKNFDMVADLPLDYMHMCCLGVMRKLFYLWFRGALAYRLCARQSTVLSERLVKISSFICREFARRPRGLTELARWKATELRQFLIYTGPYVLGGVLGKDSYKNFLYFHYAIRALLQPNVVGWIETAKCILNKFVAKFKVIYTDKFVSYNVHSLLHICDDAEKFGSLNNISAFPNENYMQTFKGMIRKADKPLQQYIRRIYEKNVVEKCKNAIKLPINYPIFTPGSLNINHPFKNCYAPYYKKVQFKSFIVTCEPDNNCVVLDTGEIVLILSIASSNGTDPVLIGRSFTYLCDFYHKPQPSRTLGIYKGKNLSRLKNWSINKITNKALCFPIDDESYYIAELLHNLN